MKKLDKFSRALIALFALFGILSIIATPVYIMIVTILIKDLVSNWILIVNFALATLSLIGLLIIFMMFMSDDNSGGRKNN